MQELSRRGAGLSSHDGFRPSAEALKCHGFDVVDEMDVLAAALRAAQFFGSPDRLQALPLAARPRVGPGERYLRLPEARHELSQHNFIVNCLILLLAARYAELAQNFAPLPPSAVVEWIAQELPGPPGKPP